MNGRVIAGTALLVAVVWAQRQPGDGNSLAFDVASLKPSDPAARGGSIRQMPGGQRYHGENVPLKMMMTVAYTVTDRQISGGPDWAGTDRYDLEAKAEHPSTSDELHVMLQHLLEERFHLKLRRESREEPAYLLTAGKGGPKMPVHDAEDKDYPPFGPDNATANDGTICPGLAGRNVTLNYFAFTLSRFMDRPVVDKTELPGRYDVALHFLPDIPRLGGGDGGGAPNFSPGCNDIYSSLPSQLGLRLEKGKGPVEYIVIEHAEKPTAN
jgi:uncharacterized protein (TIGR03435 family)